MNVAAGGSVGSTVGATVGPSGVLVGGRGSGVTPPGVTVGCEGGGGALVDVGGCGVGVRGTADDGTQICCPTLNRSLGRQLTSSSVSTGILARAARLDRESPSRME